MGNPGPGGSNAGPRRTAKRIEGALHFWMAELAKGLARQQETMDQIADTLRRPLETAVKELLRHAHHAIASGGRSEKRRRAEWYKDALDLLWQAVENPVGKQDYVAWFQIGFLLWKRDQRLGEAAEAFDRAARLSEPTRDVYYWESLRHLAYMRYLQNDPPGALEAIQEALRADANPSTLFDAARYSARNGSPAEAVRLLERGIALKPTTIVEMVGEADFDGMHDELRALTGRLVAGVRAEANELLGRWGDTLERWARIQEVGGFSVRGPLELSRARLDELRREVETADYLRCLALQQQITELHQRLTAHAKASLAQETEVRQGRVAEAQALANGVRDEAERLSAQARDKARRDIDRMGCLAWGVLYVVCLIVAVPIGIAIGAKLLNETAAFPISLAVAAAGPISIYQLLRTAGDRAVRRIEAERDAKLAELEPELRAAQAALRQIEEAARIGL